MEEIKGAVIKVSGECEAVTQICEVLESVFDIVYSSKLIYHSDDGGCHRFINVAEVRTE